MNLQAIFDKMGLRGGPGDNFPFMGLCIVAGVIATVFLAAVIIDTVRQQRKLARVRTLEAEARKRAAAARTQF